MTRLGLGMQLLVVAFNIFLLAALAWFSSPAKAQKGLDAWNLQV